MAKVSLISTVFNERESIADWLERLRKQTRQPDEIVICDAGSTDGTVEELRNFAQAHGSTPLKVIVKPGANIAAGRNAAIAEASGEIIAVTDAGCRLELDWLEMIVRPFDDAKVRAVAGYYRFAGDTPFQRAAGTYLGRPWENPDFLPSSRSIAFTKEAWKAAGGYPEWLTLAAEDTLFNALLQKQGIEFTRAPAAVVHWEMRPHLSSFLKMIRRNAFGDAEAGLGGVGAVKTLIKLLLALAVLGGLICAAVTLPPFFVATVAAPLLLAMAVLLMFVMTRNLPDGASARDFLLLKIFGGPAYLVGYLSGLFFGKRKP